MKVCLSSRQSAQYLQKADEIKVEFRDRNSLPDIFDAYPDATVILEIPPKEQINEQELINWNILSKGKLMVCLAHLEDYTIMQRLKIPFFWGYKIQTYYQLQSLKNIGVCYIKLDAPLFFDLPRVIQYGIPIRAIPNIAYDDGMIRANGVVGTWIRPEDLDEYGKYIETIEFENVTPTQERAMYRIYMEDKEWIVDLQLLIQNFNYPGNNRLLRSDLTQRRISCGQRCQSGSQCRICYRILDIANPALLKSYAEKLEQQVETEQNGES